MRKIAIVGGGQSGLQLALGLLQNQGQQLTLIMKNGAIIKRAA